MKMALSMPTRTPLARLHVEFLALLPQIRACAQFGFRDRANPEKKEDCLAEVVGLAWKWFQRLDALGKKEQAFPTALAAYAIKQVRSGRGVAGQPRAKDVFNPAAQRHADFRIEPLHGRDRPQFARACRQPTGQRQLDAWEEMVSDNTQTPVDQQAQFRIDWAAWLATRGPRDRRLIRDMLLGERTKELAAKYRWSPARISQKRRAFWGDWNRFTQANEPVVPRAT